MKWAWRLGRLAGIDLYVHATFLLLVAWVALREYPYGVVAIGTSLVYIVALFAIVTDMIFARLERRLGSRPSPG